MLEMKLFKSGTKYGFSLAEVILVLAIVGVLIAVASTALKPEKKAIKYIYMNAYNSLSKAYYNGLLLGHDPFDDNALDEGVTPSHTDANDTGTEMLCRNLTSYINTKDNVKNANQDYSSSCSATKITSQLANEFLDEKVQFVANNGMKFYITNRLGDDDYHFYIVYVDINGNKLPNSFDYVLDDNGRVREEPDIFAFAILDIGRVIPLGIPEYDSNILTARFAYFNDDGDALYSKRSMAYYQAKGAAWGYYSSKEDSLEYNDSEPYTMNDFVRSKINEESNIVKDFPDLKELSPVAVINDEEHKCSDQDIESCYVFLDAYRQ